MRPLPNAVVVFQQWPIIRVGNCLHTGRITESILAPRHTMTDHYTDKQRDLFSDPETGPQTRAELNDALGVLLTKAYTNGVDPGDDAYEIRHTQPEISDWEVHITRTTKKKL